MDQDVIEIEKKLLSAMMLKNGQAVPLVTAIVDADDFYRPEHRAIFRAITKIYFGGTPPDILAVERELRKTGKRVDRSYLFSLIDAEFTTARAEYQARAVKERSNMHKLIQAFHGVANSIQKGIRGCW